MGAAGDTDAQGLPPHGRVPWQQAISTLLCRVHACFMYRTVTEEEEQRYRAARGGDEGDQAGPRHEGEVTLGLQPHLGGSFIGTRTVARWF